MTLESTLNYKTMPFRPLTPGASQPQTTNSSFRPLTPPTILSNVDKIVSNIPQRQDYPDQASYNAAHQQWRQQGSQALGRKLPENVDTNPDTMQQTGTMSRIASNALPTIGKSFVNTGKSVVNAINPMQVGASIGGVGEGINELSKESNAADQSQAKVNAGIQHLKELIQLGKQQGKDTTSLEHALQVAGSIKADSGTGFSDVLTSLPKASVQAAGDMFPAAREAIKGNGTKVLESLSENPAQVAPALLPFVKGAPLGESKVAKGIDATIEPVKSGVKTGVDMANSGLNKIKAVGDAMQEKSITKKFDSTTGKIIQGTAEDIPRAQKALTNIDTTGVKTYQDLSAVLKDKIEQVKNTQRTAYDIRPEKVNFQDLTVKGHNFVNDALTQLQDYYSKTNNVDGLNEIQALRNKAETQGLSMREVDDLAVKHGQELNAYNANGELASGLTKQAAENTRQGLKSTVRQYMGNEAFKASDAQISDLSRTKALIDDVAEKAQALSQKIIEQPWYKRAGSLTAKVVDKMTGGNVKSFVNYFIPRGEGLKTLNALDLQKMLQKNLKTLQELGSGQFSDADMSAKLQEIIKQGNPQKLLPAPKQGMPKSSINVPIEQPSKVVVPGQEIVKRSSITTRPKISKGGGKVTQIFAGD